MTKLYRACLAAFSLLSIMPLGSFVPTRDEIRRSLAFFPLVGIVLGGVGYLAGNLAIKILPFMPVAMLMALLPEILTKGLHLDGLADAADGMLSGRPRDRKLEIMRDSHIGAMGVAAIVTMLILKFSFFANMPVRILPMTMALMLLNGRCALLMNIQLSRPARPEGMGVIWQNYYTVIGTLAALALSAFAGWRNFGPWSSLLVLLIYPAAWIWSLITRKVLGGATGDTFGCFEEIAELLTVGFFSIFIFFEGYRF